MASSIAAVLALTASLILTAMADDCDSYYNTYGVYQRSQNCESMYCCGSCNNRFCCTYSGFKFNDDNCIHSEFNVVPIVVGVSFLFITFTLIIFCCACPCCCLYKMCRKTRPVVATTTTTVVTQFPQQQQPPNPATQYAPYQPIPAQPGYPVQPGYGTPAPYQGQPYAPGPPPPYQESGGYPSPYSQAAYDGTQPPYPLNPPVHPGYSHPPPQPDYNTAQPAYNPAYVEPPKTGY